jgi:hypothetical protein
MIVYHGSIRKFEHFNKDVVVQNLSNDIDTIGFWFTSDIGSAIPFAIGTETVFEKSTTEFWDDGEPKVIQVDRQVRGYIYKVFIDESKLKEYHSRTEDSYEVFMRERDLFCDYLSKTNRKATWKDRAILLNKEEANRAFRKKLIKQKYEGFVIRNTRLPSGIIDLYCLFAADSIQIAEVIPLEEIV